MNLKRHLKRHNSAIKLEELKDLYNTHVPEDRSRTKGAISNHLKLMSKSARGINQLSQIIPVLTS
jgi:hypothetical protein